MSAPFYNNIKGTTGSSPGTGAFTPDAAATGALAWSTVQTGWAGLVRYDDGTSWELRYGYWNGTTVTRPTAGFVSSSSGSGLSLSASAIATLVADGGFIQPRLAGDLRYASPIPNSTTVSLLGLSTGTTTGTAAAVNIAATNYLTEQPRVQITSATSANSQAGLTFATICGVSSSAAGRGGWVFNARFGPSQLPTSSRLFVGMTDATFAGATSNPSLFPADFACFAKDSSDTNIQFMVNDGGPVAGKTDTSISFAANSWYETRIWSLPGSLTVYGLLIRRDTGALWYGSTATDTPVNGSLLSPNCIAGLSSAIGTAMILHFGGLTVRTGGM